jgi:hypothetical protein
VSNDTEWIKERAREVLESIKAGKRMPFNRRGRKPRSDAGKPREPYRVRSWQERFKHKIDHDPVTGCVQWRSFSPTVKIGNRRVAVYEAAFRYFGKEPHPPRTYFERTCKTKQCLQPDHLVVTERTSKLVRARWDRDSKQQAERDDRNDRIRVLWIARTRGLIDLSITDIAKLFGITRQRAHQIATSAPPKREPKK